MISLNWKQWNKEKKSRFVSLPSVHAIYVNFLYMQGAARDNFGTRENSATGLFHCQSLQDILSETKNRQDVRFNDTDLVFLLKKIALITNSKVQSLEWTYVALRCSISFHYIEHLQIFTYKLWHQGIWLSLKNLEHRYEGCRQKTLRLNFFHCGTCPQRLEGDIATAEQKVTYLECKEKELKEVLQKV